MFYGQCNPWDGLDDGLSFRFYFRTFFFRKTSCVWAREGSEWVRWGCCGGGAVCVFICFICLLGAKDVLLWSFPFIKINFLNRRKRIWKKLQPARPLNISLRRFSATRDQIKRSWRRISSLLSSLTPAETTSRSAIKPAGSSSSPLSTARKPLQLTIISLNFSLILKSLILSGAWRLRKKSSQSTGWNLRETT